MPEGFIKQLAQLTHRIEVAIPRGKNAVLEGLLLGGWEMLGRLGDKVRKPPALEVPGDVLGETTSGGGYALERSDLKFGVRDGIDAEGFYT